MTPQIMFASVAVATIRSGMFAKDAARMIWSTTNAMAVAPMMQLVMTMGIVGVAWTMPQGMIAVAVGVADVAAAATT